MTWLRNRSIRKKIITLIVFNVFLLIGVSSYGFYSMNILAANADEMYSDRTLPIEWLSEVRTQIARNDAYSLEMMITTDMSFKEKLTQYIEDGAAKNNEYLALYDKTYMVPKERELMDRTKEIAKTVLDEQKKVIGLVGENKNAEAYSYYLDKVKKPREELRSTLDELIRINSEIADELSNHSKQELDRTLNISIVLTLLVVLLSMFFGMIISQVIANPIRKLRELMAKVEQGDLSVTGDYHFKDEIGQLNHTFNGMVDGLRTLVEQVKEKSLSLSANSEQLSASAEQTSRASEEIATTIASIAVGTDNQVQSIESGRNVLQEINTIIENIAKNAENVNRQAQDAAFTATEGNRSIQTTIEQMNSIIQTMTSLANVIKGLGERSQHIGSIVEVIRDIAGQTNLLALNAAIESARAGEHGRGFAVVADEVRKLAEQSTASAGKIGEYIQIIQADIQNAVYTMETGMEEVGEGARVVNVAGESFKRIESSVSEVAEQIQYVSVSSSEMVTSTRLTNMITGIAEVAVSNAAGTQQASAATEEQLAIMEEITSSSQALSKMAEEMQILISRFKV
ncbi:methyl-accepting chemotaxis protein [Brevibacillus sp. SYSU BS000544]|uniref:methyl-accepting chemotaxis protein n=1 Tax=Brevibacillus sp. SYSU BS000544 TaxID=3416443 RepID=UPI003CE46EEA